MKKFQRFQNFTKNQFINIAIEKRQQKKYYLILFQELNEEKKTKNDSKFWTYELVKAGEEE